MSTICQRCNTPGPVIDVFGDVRCFDCWGSPHLPPKHARELLNEAEELCPSTAPWMVDAIANVGENWLIAEFGYSDRLMDRAIVTTDRVRTSEDIDGDGDAESDAAFLVWCRNHWEDIKGALMQASASYEEAGL